MSFLSDMVERGKGLLDSFRQETKPTSPRDHRPHVVRPR